MGIMTSIGCPQDPKENSFPLKNAPPFAAVVCRRAAVPYRAAPSSVPRRPCRLARRPPCLPLPPCRRTAYLPSVAAVAALPPTLIVPRRLHTHT